MSPNKHIGVLSTDVEEIVISQIRKDSAGGSDTPDKYKLFKTEYGNNEEQQHTQV